MGLVPAFAALCGVAVSQYINHGTKLAEPRLCVSFRTVDKVNVPLRKYFFGSRSKLAVDNFVFTAQRPIRSFVSAVALEKAADDPESLNDDEPEELLANLEDLQNQPLDFSDSPSSSRSSNRAGAHFSKSSVIHAPQVWIGDEEPVPPSVSDFRVSEDTVKELTKRGITYFTPIQFESYDLIYDGRDIVGKSRTGTGKTLAFALPIVEQLKQDVRRNVRGRSPRCLVLAPTRELAKQVAREFEIVGKDAVDVVCIYGGTSYIPQENALRKGVDVVVATPGRLIDMMDKEAIDLSCVQHAVLDEADEMLRMGFEEDVEKIFDLLPSDRQTLMFSATLPAWARNISRKHLRDPVTIDTVGTSKLKTSETVRHVAMCCYPQARANILRDLITLYGKDRTIVFTMTKKDADDLASTMRDEAQVLHGDIAQNQRERTLAGFRDGQFRILIATDVAARGLDIPSVDLVVQYQIPMDSETYIHRSGRTGRAGRQGTALVLHRHDERNALRQLEKEIGVKFEPVSIPKPEEVLAAAAQQAAAAISTVSEEVTSHFEGVASELLAEHGVHALARALATVAGVKKISKRSLLTAMENHTMVLVRSRPPLSVGAVKAIIGRVYPAAFSRIGKIELCAEGAVVDLPSECAEELVSIEHKERSLSFEIPSDVPVLVSPDEFSSYGGRPRRGRAGDSYRGRGRDNGRDRDSFASRRGSSRGGSYSSYGGGSGRSDRGGSREYRGGGGEYRARGAEYRDDGAKASNRSPWNGADESDWIPPPRESRGGPSGGRSHVAEGRGGSSGGDNITWAFP